MAWKELVDSALKVVEKVLNDASLWFWLGVAAVTLLVADKRGAIPLTLASMQPRVAIAVTLVLIVALWLNALHLHDPLQRGIVRLRVRIADWQQKRRGARLAGQVAAGAEEKLRDLLGTHCRERRWLLWFIAQLERDPGLLLPYGTVLHDPEFAGARSLIELGLLHRTGDSHSALVFVHRKIYGAYRAAFSDKALASQLNSERREIDFQGRAALTAQLPRYATERFFREVAHRAT